MWLIVLRVRLIGWFTSCRSWDITKQFAFQKNSTQSLSSCVLLCHYGAPRFYTLVQWHKAATNNFVMLKVTFHLCLIGGCSVVKPVLQHWWILKTSSLMFTHMQICCALLVLPLHVWTWNFSAPEVPKKNSSTFAGCVDTLEDQKANSSSSHQTCWLWPV